MTSSNFIDHFSTLEAPRQSWKIIYPLEEILLIVLCGLLSGCDDFVEIEHWSGEKLAFLKQFSAFKNGVPSHDTLNDVMNALPADLFVECFTGWVNKIRSNDPDIIAIDGKTSRRAHGSEGRALHLVSAWASRQRLVLGQQACREKQNEISAIPCLLQRLELQGALVTIDAMGCQSKIAGQICDQGGDYLLAVKGNNKKLHEELVLFFDVATGLETHSSINSDHGRIEQRDVSVCYSVDWLSGSRHDPSEPKFPNLATLVRVAAKVEQKGEVSQSSRYYICSAKLTAEQVGSAIRGHWGIENSLHWIMDVVFHDDLMRLRTRFGPQNMATMRHVALNIINRMPGKKSKKVKRKSMAWSETILKNTLTAH